MSKQHAPTPYHVGVHHDRDALRDAESREVLATGHLLANSDGATFAFIALACNTFDDAREALRDLLAAMPQPKNVRREFSYMVARAQATKVLRRMDGVADPEPLPAPIPGYDVRHDLAGFYVCTDEEAEHEDAGNPSAGFDGRPHYPTIADAWAAAKAMDDREARA